MALIEGVRINLGGREFVAPPLNFKALRQLTPKLAILASMGDVPTNDQTDVVLDVADLSQDPVLLPVATADDVAGARGRHPDGSVAQV